jgi:phosphoadenosine phosphosulfate reductase
MFRDYLDEITVAWLDAGDSFPETYEQMERVKTIAPHFVAVPGRVWEVRRKGIPVDSVISPREQHWTSCCFLSKMLPLRDFCREIGAEKIIRGQKDVDRIKSPIRSGAVVEGITYIFPLQSWTEDEVSTFIKGSEFLQVSEASMSMDCMRCTGLVEENSWRQPFLKKHYPLIALEVERLQNGRL